MGSHTGWALLGCSDWLVDYSCSWCVEAVWGPTLGGHRLAVVILVDYSCSWCVEAVWGPTLVGHRLAVVIG